MGVVRVIVEFLATAGIMDISPALVAQRMVAVAVRSEYGAIPLTLRILQERHEILAVELGDGREAAQLVQGGKQIDQADRPRGARLRARNSRRRDNQRAAGGTFS